MNFMMQDGSLTGAEKNQSMPLVDLMVSNNPNDPISNNAENISPSRRGFTAPVVQQPAAFNRPLLRPDDSQIPPEPGAISEQPELSHVRRMKDEMDMHRNNAKSGVAFMSQSERYSGSHNKSNQRHTKSPKSKHSTTGTTTTSTTTHKNKHAPRDNSSLHDSSYYDYDESGTISETATPVQSHKSNKRDRESKSHSSHRHRRREGNELLKQQVNEAIQSDNKNGLSADAQSYSDLGKKSSTAHPDEKDVLQTSSGTASNETPKATKLDTAKRFVSQNILLIVACIIFLALVGVGIYLLFKGGRETSKQTQERLQQTANLEEEQSMQGRDAVLQELQQKNDSLQAANLQTAQLLQAYENQLVQFKGQNELQMQAIEKINAEREMYEQALAEWEQWGQHQKQQEEPSLQQEQQTQQDQEQQDRQDRQDQQDQQAQSFISSDEAGGTQLVMTQDGQWIRTSESDIVSQQQEYMPQSSPQRDPLPKIITTPENLAPPVENRRQPPLMFLEEGQQSSAMFKPIPEKETLSPIRSSTSSNSEENVTIKAN